MTPQQIEDIRVKLGKAADLIDEASQIFDDAEKNLKASPVEKALSNYYYMDAAYEILDNSRKAFAKKVEFLKNSLLPEMMEQRGVKSINLSVDRKPYRFTVNVRQSCSMVDKDGGVEWLRENGQGGLIQQTVNASSLSAFSKQWVEDRGADLPEAYFKVTTMKYISVTKG